MAAAAIARGRRKCDMSLLSVLHGEKVRMRGGGIF
jgi:hypothetical protein